MLNSHNNLAVLRGSPRANNLRCCSHYNWSWRSLCFSHLDNGRQCDKSQCPSSNVSNKSTKIRIRYCRCCNMHMIMFTGTIIKKINNKGGMCSSVIVTRNKQYISSANMDYQYLLFNTIFYLYKDMRNIISRGDIIHNCSARDFLILLCDHVFFQYSSWCTLEFHGI